MAAEQQPRREVQRVLLVRGGVVERRVQGHEVVPFRVHFRTPGAREAQAAKDGPDVVDDPADRMDRALASGSAAAASGPGRSRRTTRRATAPAGDPPARGRWRLLPGWLPAPAAGLSSGRSPPRRLRNRDTSPSLRPRYRIRTSSSSRWSRAARTAARASSPQPPQILDHDALRCRTHPSVPSPARVPWPPSSGD